MRDNRKIILPGLVVLAAIAVAMMAALPNKGISSSISPVQDESSKAHYLSASD